MSTTIVKYLPDGSAPLFAVLLGVRCSGLQNCAQETGSLT